MEKRYFHSKTTPSPAIRCPLLICDVFFDHGLIKDNG